MSSFIIGTIAHISDLHFTQKLTEKGRRRWTKGGLKSHSFAKTEALAGEFRKFRRWGLDVVVATGDISTDGDIGSLETARKFLETDRIYEYPPRRLLGRGLALEPERCLIVPGNHDRYGQGPVPLQTGFLSFESVFSEPDEGYPYVIGCQLKPSAYISTPAIIFFVFDSTLPKDVPAAAWNRIARGHIRETECTWLREQKEEIRRSKQVLGLNGEFLQVDYDNSIRIAVLHHHPVIPQEEVKVQSELQMVQSGPATARGWVGNVANKLDYDSMLMINDRLFMGACFDVGIDIVLFGHQHQAYRRICRPDDYSDFRKIKDTTAHDIHLFCCPTTTEYKAKDSGFYLIHFFTNYFKVVPYIWNKSEENGYSFIEDVENTEDYEYARNIPWSTAS